MLEQITLQSAAQFVVLLGAAAGVLVGLVRWSLRALDSRLDTRLKPIIEQLNTNGGSSLRDEVRSIKADVARMSADLAVLEEGRIADKEKVSALQARLDTYAELGLVRPAHQEAAP